jgi:hypothetical protein
MSIEQSIDRLSAAIEALASVRPTGTASADAATPAKTPVASASKPVAARQPAKARPAPAPTPEAADADEEVATELSREAVGEKIVALIQSNQRPAAVKILKDHGAKAVSEVKPEDFQAVHDAATAILDTL